MTKHYAPAPYQDGAPYSRTGDDLFRTSSPSRKPTGRWQMAAMVAFFVLIGHAPSINTGLYLDDHAHYMNLRGSDWSFRSAVEASRLGIVGDVMDLWGRQETGLRFFRPIAFWIMRLEYTVACWQPEIMHIFSVGWHFACCMLVGALAMRCFGRRLWAIVAASLMAIHPAQVPTVYWIACQTELLTTFFLLLGILAYSRHAGWGQPPLAQTTKKNVTSRPWFLPPASGCFITDSPARMGEAQIAAPIRRVTLFAIVAILCYGLGLGCRENAVLFPLVCWLGDRLCGTPRRGLIRWEHVAMLLVLATYLVLRYVMLGGFPMPGRPYIVPISDPAFLQHAIGKVMCYTLGLFGCLPLVPLGGMAYFTSRPLVLYGGFAFVVAILLLIWAVYRFRRPLLLPLAWIACLIAPLLPVFASSHHLYLPSVGMALFYGAGLAAVGGFRRPVGTRSPPLRAILCAGLLITITLGLGTLSWGIGFTYKRGTLSEDVLVEDVIQRGRPIHEGDHVFFINMPLVAYYAIPAIKAQDGIQELHGHILTFATSVSLMETPGEVEVLDTHTLRIRAPHNEKYLSGVTGKAMLVSMGLDRMPPQGKKIEAGLFTVVPTQADDEGIRELLFTFTEPLDSPHYHFFLSSPQFLAYPLDVSSPTARLDRIATGTHEISANPRKSDSSGHPTASQK